MSFNRIIFYELGFNEDPDLFDKLLPRVSIDKRKRIMQMQSDIDRKLSLYAEVLVRCIACRALNINNSNIEIIRNEYGKPYWKGNQDFHFNISHTHNAIAVAVADSPVGIDIERVRPVNDLVVRRFYSAREQKYVYGSREETNARFSEVWTRKEACIKCNERDTSVRAFHIDAFKGKIAKQIKTFSIKGYYISVCCSQLLEKVDSLFQEEFRNLIVENAGGANCTKIIKQKLNISITALQNG